MRTIFGKGAVRADRLARMARARLSLRGTDRPPDVTGLCTDSREAGPGDLFCAIRGARTDGHLFLGAAASAGCACFLCERLPGEADVPRGAFLLTDDVTEALLRLAEAWREAEIPRLRLTAVTGSVGKTTTKDCAAAALSGGLRVFRREGNPNSLIGLPLTVAGIGDGYDAAVLEMGMSDRGEIGRMSRAVRPDLALITNVGSSHLGRLGTRENIARAKLEIAEGLPEGGTLLINGDDPLLRDALPAAAARGDIRVRRLSLVGAAGADFAIVPEGAGEGRVRFGLALSDGAAREIGAPRVLPGLRVAGYGRPALWAGGFAAAVGVLHGLAPDRIARGLQDFRPAGLRQHVRQAAGVTFLEDCYNASPESVRAALETLRELPAARRVAVLGDMLELGAASGELHRAAGRDAFRCGADLLYAVGTFGRWTAEGARDAGMPASSVRLLDGTGPAAAAELASELRDGDAILFKASRAVGMEGLSQAVIDLRTAAPR